MKKMPSILLLSFVGWQAARAQVAVEVTLEQEQFLRGESIPVAVRVSNRSGRTLTFGEDPDWLTFTLQSREGSLVNHEGEVPVQGSFALDSAKVATKRVNLAPYFALTRPGRYILSANVHIKEWDGMANSPPKNFDIVEGTKVWSQQVGVPVAVATTNQAPEVRTYTLLQANSIKSELRLYFRLTDASDARVIKAFPLGNIVSFARPEAEVDGQSRIHILHQNAARTSIYTVITADGDIEQRELYDYGKVRPQLRPDAAGKISVAGGIRRTTDRDIPASKSIENEVKPATP